MIASRYNEKHSNFIIAITKSIFITQFSNLYHYKGLETHILNIIKLFVKTELFFFISECLNLVLQTGKKSVQNTGLNHLIFLFSNQNFGNPHKF